MVTPRRESRSRAVLRGTVAAVCVASVAAAPVTAAAPGHAAAPPAPAPAPKAATGEGAGAPKKGVEVRVGATAEFTRVEFAGPQGVRAGVLRQGNKVTVTLPKGAEPDLARLRVDPPAGVTGVDTRLGAKGLEIVVTLDDGADVKFGRADGVVYLNLYPPAGETPAEMVAAASGAAPEGGVVKVQAAVEGQQLTLRFPWRSQPGAAVFRRGKAVFIVFDAQARLDLSEAPKSLGGVKRVRWASGPDSTVVRVEAPETLPVSASAEGSVWSVTFGGGATSDEAPVKIGRDDQTGPPALTAALAGATRVIWLVDPAVGDRIAAVTAVGPPKPQDAERDFVETTLLRTVHGVAVVGEASDLQVAVEGELVRISRPRGLSLSPPSTQARATALAEILPRPAALPALVDFEGWSRTGEQGFMGRYRQLQELAAAEGAKGEGAPVAARMGLARFLVGSELAYEAIGVLDMVARQNPAMLSDPELRGLRGAARAMVGRYKEAQADFSSAVLSADASSALWRGYIDAKLGAWEEARKAFQYGARAIDLFSPKWRARFGTAHAKAALEMKDVPAAKTLLSFVFAQNTDPDEQLAASLVQARVLEAENQTDKALAIYDSVARAPLGALSTPALMGQTRIRYNKGLIPATEAVKQLAGLKYRWRGDATELEIISTLGEIYLSQGRYREALDALRSAGKRLPDLPAALALQTQLATAFRNLFLGGQADGLQPVQALALFYDFRELTPIGADGDEMVRKLSRRLVDVDLLPQAAELLKYQVDNRLDGAAKSQVATDLAAVYLMDRKPEQALQAIWGSRTTLLPTALNARRRVLEARALADLNRYDNALEVLGKDAAPDAQDLRAEIAWRQKEWVAAGLAYEKRLGDRFKTPKTALTGEEETRLIRAGVAYTLAADGPALQRLSDRFGPFIESARAPEALRIALAGLDGGELSAQDFARATAQADTFASWVAAMKKRFRDSAAGAVRQAAAGAAAKAG